MAVSKASLRAARHAAALLIKEFHITKPEEIVLEDIAMAKEIFVFEGPLEGAEARLLRRDNRGIVRLKSGLSLGRKRFAIAHEMGHWELHAKVSQLSLCTADDIAGYGNIDAEIEANAFAGAFLMPTQLISAQCWEATPSLELVNRLADEFFTSISAAAVRLVEECRQTCIVVFSENGRVRWWRARDYERVWIQPGQQIDHRSNAFELSGQSEMESVDLDVWFPDWEGHDPQDLCEQSMVLGHYGTVLTLLWLVDAVEDEY
jgi:Zn-dependent peptidase ImmA (M78 family)